MRTVRIHRSEHDRFGLVSLEDGRVSVTVVPELGARLMSLRDLRSGREWLWRPAGPLRLWRNQPGDPFPLGTFVGADECLPTVGACTWEGREQPDHGEVWNQPWVLDEDALAAGRIGTSISLKGSPFHFNRTLSLQAGVLRMDYALHNQGDRPEPWLWAWHPLMAFEPGDQLSLPYDVKTLRVECARQPDASRGEIWTWPAANPGLRLDELKLGGNDSYLKAFAGPLRDGWALLENLASGSSLTLRWDVDALPYVGLWLTRGGYRGWHHVALEPTNLPADALAEGVRENAPPPLAPGATLRWWLEITLANSSRCDTAGSPKGDR
jgi:galactose mutarotase-like enzyme